MRILIASTLILFSGCLQSPAVRDPASVSTIFIHTLADRNKCAPCHETNRPGQTQSPPPSLLASTGHFTGQDCSACHQPLNASPTAATFSFSHMDAFGGVLRTCLPCHEARRKSIDHYAGKDCALCHIDPSKPWASASGSPHPQNQPTLVSCVGCHEAGRPATTLFPAPGVRTNGHFPATDCFSCHLPKTATVVKFVFDHQASGQTLPFCIPCHEAKRPTVPAHHVGIDCAQCHSSLSSWLGATYTHTQQETSCNSCHESGRPQPNHYVTKDCAACHISAGGSIVKFVFGHSNSLNQDITFCLPCHLSDGQKEHKSSSSVSFSGDGNCYNCHNKARRSFKH